jgi:hypothetical protein
VEVAAEAGGGAGMHSIDLASAGAGAASGPARRPSGSGHRGTADDDLVVVTFGERPRRHSRAVSGSSADVMSPGRAGLAAAAVTGTSGAASAARAPAGTTATTAAATGGKPSGPPKMSPASAATAVQRLLRDLEQADRLLDRATVACCAVAPEVLLQAAVQGNAHERHDLHGARGLVDAASSQSVGAAAAAHFSGGADTTGRLCQQRGSAAGALPLVLPCLESSSRLILHAVCHGIGVPLALPPFNRFAHPRGADYYGESGAHADGGQGYERRGDGPDEEAFSGVEWAGPMLPEWLTPQDVEGAAAEAAPDTLAHRLTAPAGEADDAAQAQPSAPVAPQQPWRLSLPRFDAARRRAGSALLRESCQDLLEQALLGFRGTESALQSLLRDADDSVVGGLLGHTPAPAESAQSSADTAGGAAIATKHAGSPHGLEGPPAAGIRAAGRQGCQPSAAAAPDSAETRREVAVWRRMLRERLARAETLLDAVRSRADQAARSPTGVVAIAQAPTAGLGHTDSAREAAP